MKDFIMRVFSKVYYEKKGRINQIKFNYQIKLNTLKFQFIYGLSNIIYKI